MTIINLKLSPFVAFAFVFGVAAIAGTLIFVVSEQPMAEPSGEPVVTRQPAAADESAGLAPEPEPQDETANWKAYRNEEYGFEVRYPPEFYFSESGDKQGPRVACFASYREYTNNRCVHRPDEDRPQTYFATGKFGLEIDENIAPQNIAQEELLKLEHGRGFLGTLQEERYLSINGIPAYRLVRRLAPGDESYGEIYEGVQFTFIKYALLKGRNVFIIDFEIYNDQPEETIEKVDQILSTFRFLE